MINRRKFIKTGSLATISIALGMDIVYAHKLPKGMELIICQTIDQSVLPNKHREMVVLNDRPINAEAPAHLLDEDITSGDRFFCKK